MNASVLDKYELVVGLEVHVQLATQTKAFCSDAVSFGDDANTHTSVVSLAHPGTLPRLNEKQIEYAVRLGLALGCEIDRESRFDRKNYFYADLPKGYQTTQDARPIAIGGEMTILGNKKIRLHHIHMEEDAGKSIHDLDPNLSMIDLNRAGTPLLEIVTEPDFRSAEEVEAFMYQMRQLVRYLEVSDGNMEQGSMRCDCNVSVRLKGAKEFGERCEVKNMNSMKFAKMAINYEFRRQIQLLEQGDVVLRNTLNFNPQTGITTPLRSKEDAHDYRYFPDLDQLPVHISKEFVNTIKEQLPQLPWELKETFQKKYGLSSYNATLLTEEKGAAYYFLELAEQDFTNYKSIANLMINKIMPWAKEQQQKVVDFVLSPTDCLSFLELIDKQLVNNSTAYQKLWPELIKQKGQYETPLALAEKLDLIQKSDSSAVESIVAEILTAHPQKVDAYKKGKKGLIGFFMGDFMKKTKGKYNPKEAQQLLVKALSK